MGLLGVFATALSLSGAALASPIQERAVAAKYCDAASTLCFSEWVSPEKIAYRFAIPDTATAGNFDVILQIEAPKTVGWAGIAWGGVMTNNPLTVAWANGASAIATTRKASARTYPQPATDVTYTVIPSLTKANTTHWTYTAVAKGASSFGTTRLNPASTAVSFAYAQAAGAPATPADPASRFSIHNSRGKFTADLAAAKIADFTALAEKLTKA
ncbi:hypothetical protein QBC34DRAFT_420108 [Podospora aff. communis PSN243]|uniref:Cellobiose dehydrogenase-like cytochrome domain-containing protein n=1 Tax=Podospora aff. communis PSN243 TaxID=3040156 RepID=A0AAV9H3W6_9PEZI|nr:hypothetical protein QBC34DRAFT_420108 [Podospora aff. communis PSN243]